MSRRIITGILILAVNLGAFAQVTVVESGEDGPKLSLSGGLTGMVSIGFMDETKQFAEKGSATGSPFPGVLYTADEKNVYPGKTGYSASMNFSILFSPVSYADLFVKFLAQYRPGSPYMPLSLESADAKTFSDFSIDNAWGRINAIGGLRLNVPVDIWLKAGKYDVTPVQFQNVTRFGTESVMTSLRTTNTYNMQIEAVYGGIKGAKALSLGFTTHMKLKEALPVLLDEDEIREAEFVHGYPKIGVGDIPIHLALRLEDYYLSIGRISAEAIYAYNAMGIYSGNNFGINVGAKLSFIDRLTIPVGLGFAMYGKNIDPFANTAIYENKTDNSLYDLNGYNKDEDLHISWDSSTTSYRTIMRMGFSAGAQYDITEDIAAELNLGFAFSQIAHYYRQDLTLISLSVDLRGSFQSHYFLGGGIFLGSLTNAEWKTKSSVDPDTDDFNHTFKLAENMGFEVYGGLRMGNSRFVLGYNINRGLSMNNSIESAPDGQIKYRQKGTLPADGLFERGGFFTKLAISW